jgi:outer membrane immunogenic protein
MKQTLAIATLAFILAPSGNALAADLNSGGIKDAAYISAPAWAGFYIGLNGGYGQNVNSPDMLSYVVGTPYAISEGFSSKGAFGGAQAGYNIKASQLVFGLETDLQLAELQSSKDVDTSVSGLTRHLEQNVNWLGTVRGRVGYSFGSVLFYGTGGFAAAGINTKVVSSLASTIPVAHYGRTDTETGYTAGGGLEYLITPSWSAKAEYQYIDLGKAALSGTSLAGAVATNSLDNSFHTVRIGFNYHLGDGMAAVMPLK